MVPQAGFLPALLKGLRRPLVMDGARGVEALQILYLRGDTRVFENRSMIIAREAREVLLQIPLGRRLIFLNDLVLSHYRVSAS